MVFEIDFPVKPDTNPPDHVRADSLHAWGKVVTKRRLGGSELFAKSSIVPAVVTENTVV
jgi:hypothetical protein